MARGSVWRRRYRCVTPLVPCLPGTYGVSPMCARDAYRPRAAGQSRWRSCIPMAIAGVHAQSPVIHWLGFPLGRLRRNMVELGVCGEQRGRHRDRSPSQASAQLQGIQGGLAAEMVVGNEIRFARPPANDFYGVDDLIELLRRIAVI